MKKAEQGMTLLEVIVAVAIFALVAIALLGAISSGTRRASQLMDKQIATWVAENISTEALLDGALFPPSGKEGVADMMGRRWYWTGRGTSLQEQKMWRNDVSVRADKDAQATLVTLHSWLAIQRKNARTKTPTR
jgi:general secretion pathway protein I